MMVPIDYFKAIAIIGSMKPMINKQHRKNWARKKKWNLAPTSTMPFEYAPRCVNQSSPPMTVRLAGSSVQPKAKQPNAAARKAWVPMLIIISFF